MELVSKAASLVVEYGPRLAVGLAAAAAALSIIAPFTKTKADDKLLGLLSKAQAALAWVLVKSTPVSARGALVAEVERQAAAKVAKR